MDSSNTPSTSTRAAGSKELARKDDSTRYRDAALTPPVDVVEDSGGITLFADLPGV